MLDLFVVALYAVGMLGLGWWGMKRARNREDYLVAGRRLGPGMYIGTLSAVVLGGASTVGTVKLGYTYGLSGLWLCASLGLGLIVLSVVLAKPLMKLKLYTVTQVLERRYSPAAKLISSLIMFAYDLMLAVTSTIGIGTVLSVIFGMPAWQAVVIGGVVVVIYSTIGGMWSLTLTDIVQFLIMTVGMVALLLPLTIDSVGLECTAGESAGKQLFADGDRLGHHHHLLRHLFSGHPDRPGYLAASLYRPLQSRGPQRRYLRRHLLHSLRRDWCCGRYCRQHPAAESR